MELITTAPRGTQDVLPEESYKWQIVEDVMRRVAQSYGFSEIRTPVFEHTELFLRSVGDTTDVVQKEMYTFKDKADRSITLRPEGTASVARAVLEHGLYNNGLPIKTYYFDSCYRYEKPQAGRLREFHQFGVETFGAPLAVADAEIIALARSIFECLGLNDKLRLQINSIGCEKCRVAYQNALKAYFDEHKEKLCHTCIDRLDRNPLRIFDCKSPICHEVTEDAPIILDYLCDECKEHFEQVKKYLDTSEIEYEVNANIVRGLDYYTKTVFEFVYRDKDSELTVCGGGRYDNLISELGGVSIPSLGFGVGMERILMILSNKDSVLSKIEKPTCDLYIIGLGEKCESLAFKLCETIREGSLNAQCDLSGRSLKAQLKYADKIGAKYSLIIGEDEISSGFADLKDMSKGDKNRISLGENFFDEFSNIYLTKFAGD